MTNSHDDFKLVFKHQDEGTEPLESPEQINGGVQNWPDSNGKLENLEKCIPSLHQIHPLKTPF